MAELATEVGITFCYAQVFHPAMRFAAGARRGLGVPTAFNVLGPLTNPARAGAAAVGVADRRLAPLVAGVFGTRDWMGKALARQAGRATSSAKATASRANGRKGGRPRKQA